jgi:hypothetical protein
MLARTLNYLFPLKKSLPNQQSSKPDPQKRKKKRKKKKGRKEEKNYKKTKKTKKAAEGF